MNDNEYEPAGENVELSQLIEVVGAPRGIDA